jgi:DNA ligase-associated metallophosphoesterase
VAEIRFADAKLLLDASGALWWPAQRALIVADLHLEKGSAYARRGTLLPPYDTHATLTRLEMLVERHRPAMVVSLGDGFHDRRAAESLDPVARGRIRALTAAVRWIWVNGNHDPHPPEGLGGDAVELLTLGDILLRHHPDGRHGAEMIGHLHPKARVAGARRAITRPCFAGDPTRLLLPAFGAYTGGLNVLDRAIAGLFPSGFDAFVLGDARVFRMPHTSLKGDPEPMYRVG